MNEIKFDINTLARFANTLRYNVTTYLDLYRLFIVNNQPFIIQYFKQSDVEADAFSFDFMNKLRIEARKISDLIGLHSNSFDRVDDWFLLEMLENIRIKLDTLYNTDKWLRSNKTKNNWNKTSIQFNQTLAEGDTLEKISEQNSSIDPQNDWTQIAIENNLMELDYDSNGGKSVELHKKLMSSPSIFLNSVVDRGLTGEKLYGLDFNAKIQWTDNDLNILTYKDTVIQSISILINLKQGDIPEFDKMGLKPNLIGSNLNLINTFMIKNQLSNVIGSDDSLRNFQLNEIKYNNSKLFINYSLDTMYNLSLNSQSANL